MQEKDLQRPYVLLFGLALLAIVVTAFLSLSRQKPCAEACVVLLGDSITARWQSLPAGGPIAGLQIVNRGVPTEDTAQMLARFDHDVLQLRPRVVVILGGTNDVVRIAPRATQHNLAAMTEAAERNGIRVVLCTLPPTGDFDSVVAPELAAGHEQISALNGWLKTLAGQKHYALADYHSVLADEQGRYLKGLTTDGVHPSSEGYARMEPVLREAVASAAK